jgi:thymidine phosphorylase
MHRGIDPDQCVCAPEQVEIGAITGSDGMPAGPKESPDTARPGLSLRIRRLGLDTGRENVAVLPGVSQAIRPELFRSFSRVQIAAQDHSIIATLMTAEDGQMVAADELGLTEPAFRRLGCPEGSVVTLAPVMPPESLEAVRGKIAGRPLSAADLKAIVGDLAGYRYADIEIAAFLVGAASFLNTNELLALTRAMADAGTRLKWPQAMVLDKHCIGGIPGNRTSMIVVPIVAAHGLLIPKTSSRAITSPAGTADTMEVLARVDLDTDAMRRVVEECGGCLVWGGHVRLSPADDVLISIERPLRIDTRELMVASILSKKLAAGSTHLLIDIPVGPHAKVHDDDEAVRLRKLFEFVGDQLGLKTEVLVTDGRQPIGIGIGPVLEARDVMRVLSCDPLAPADLREKSIRIAGRLLENDPHLRGGAGAVRARELLESGAALRTMERIVQAQGPPPAVAELGTLSADVVAEKHGTVVAIDNLRLNGLARLAGAPIAKGAGIELRKKLGDHVEVGEPLYRIHASEPFEFEFALTSARRGHGYHLSEVSKGAAP